MRKYKTLTNLDDFNLKGFHYKEGKMIRTYCHCGFSDSEIHSTCPVCGNTEFINNAKRIREFSWGPAGKNSLDDPYAIHATSYYYTIAKNDQEATKLIQCNKSTEIRLVAQRLACEIEDWFDTTEFNAVPEYCIAKNIFKKYQSKSWSCVCQFVLTCKQEYPDIFSETLINRIIGELGETNIVDKLMCIAHFSWHKSIKYTRETLKTMNIVVRDLCDEPEAFNTLIGYNGYHYCQGVSDGVWNILLNYYFAGYISPTGLEKIITALYNFSFNEVETECFIKFFKESYALIQHNPNHLREFLIDMRDKKVYPSAKEFFLNKSMQKLMKGYKKTDVISIKNSLK